MKKQQTKEQKSQKNETVKTIIIGEIALILFILLAFSEYIVNLYYKNKIAKLENSNIGIIVGNANAPKLSAGMIPVKCVNDFWQITTEKEWGYNYENSEPAYMMLNDGTYQSELVQNMEENKQKLASENIGAQIQLDELGSIYMWIPRFEVNDTTGKIKYIQNVGEAEDGYTIPDLFMYKQTKETAPDFLLIGAWVAIDTDENYTTTINNMTGEDNTYGFIANTKSVQITNEDINMLNLGDISTYYGKEVTNYSAGGVSNWRVFHVDESTDNIYLITDDYVPNANLPTDTSGTALAKNGAYKAYWNTTVLGHYSGSAWIRSNTKTEAQKWLSYVNDDNYPTSENNNIKAVAYMMDTNSWSGFADSIYAEYAIGGPTLELYCASYKVTHPDKYVECTVASETGYKVKLSTNSSYSNNLIVGGTDFNSIYTISSTTKAQGFYLACPSASDTNRVMRAYYNSTLDNYNYNNENCAFRPIVCLKSGVKLVSNGDDTYSIKLVQNADNTGFNITDLTNGINDITNTNRVILKIINNKDMAPKLTFDVNGGTTTVENITVKYGETITLPTPERKYTITYVTNNSQTLEDSVVSYTFDGWYTDATGGEKREYTTMPAHNETLYAHWTETSIALPTPTPESKYWTFEGWYSDSELTTSVGAGGATYTPTEDITLYAKWQTQADYYGALVTNYSAGGVSAWRVFHIDDNDNIYLITDDYVPNAKLPKSTAGNSLNTNGTYKAYFTNVLSDYSTGSAWIRENTNTNAQKWLSYVTSYPSSTNNNIKAVAYMMDTDSWSGFADSTYAEYAIGGPTLELYCASYKVTHPNKYIECTVASETGYKVKWSSDSSYAYDVMGMTKDDFNKIYINSSSSTAYGYWLASPSDYGSARVVRTFYGGYIYVGTYSTTNDTNFAFRPVVCLKSGVELVSNGDGTYSIQ